MRTRSARYWGWGMALLCAATVHAQNNANAPTRDPGRAVYAKACASCHDHPEATRAPALDALQAMSYETINYALTRGKMQAMAAGLSDSERMAVAYYLASHAPNVDDWTAKAMCTGKRREIDTQGASFIGNFGFDLQNHRSLTAAQAGLRAQDFGQLELAWALGFPKATTMRSQPVFAGTTMFLPVSEARAVYAIDIDGPPCVKWVYKTDMPLRSSASLGELPDKRKAIAVGDVGANIYLIDARTGASIWKQHVGLYQVSMTTGTPVFYKERLYVPISQYEIILGADPKYLCCTTHGAVKALDLLTGATIWTAHTMEDAKPVRDRGDGQMIWGPSGAPIWNSPSIDEKRGVLYVGTGEATSEPAHRNTDSILAIDLKSGAIRWAFQATENDIYLSGCINNKTSLNCVKNTVFRDVDFGASTMLTRRSDGSDILLAGQKSGTVWAFDPDANGKLLWRRDLGVGSALGGIHWGITTDGKRVFAPINRPNELPPDKQDPKQKPGIHALDIDTGKVLWSYSVEPDCSGGRRKAVRNCQYNNGLSAAPAVIDGAVVTGSLDGFIRVFNGETGAVLFKYDTARAFDTVNGVKAAGGAIDSASITAANGYLFVASGYGMFGQTPGNVVLAFRPKAK